MAYKFPMKPGLKAKKLININLVLKVTLHVTTDVT